jgi:hypothetical protein
MRGLVEKEGRFNQCRRVPDVHTSQGWPILRHKNVQKDIF